MGRFGKVQILVLVFVMLVGLSLRIGGCLVLLLGLRSEMELFLVL